MRTPDSTPCKNPPVRLTPFFPHLRKTPHAQVVDCMKRVTLNALAFLFPQKPQD